MLVDQLADAPNPQFVRSDTRLLNGTWRFQFDDNDEGLADRWFEQPGQFDKEIIVPFPPESELSGIHDSGFHPVLWYSRHLTNQQLERPDGAGLLLRFGALDYRATVWVDGSVVGQHVGGHTPFSLDIGWALDPTAREHWVVVRAFDDPHDVEQPRGKQDWQLDPHVIWYHRTSGIWQSVWLEPVPTNRVETVRWRFDAERWLLDYEIELTSNPQPGSTVSLDLDIEGDRVSTVMVSAGSRTVSGQVSLGRGPGNEDRRRLLWSPDNPNLISITVTFRATDALVDTVHSYTGLRTVECVGRRLLINGAPVFLRFVLQQGYWPQSHIAAPSLDALRAEVERILELGFNGARIHQKVEDPRFMYWADRLGLLLWGETANAFAYSERAIDRHTVEWREAVIRDRNHPSIIGWVPFNESWGVGELGRSEAQRHAVTAAYHRTHQLDGTRPVVGNDGWENTAGDMFTIHDYSWSEHVLADRYDTEHSLEATLREYFPGSRRLVVGQFNPANKPVIVTEFGGVSFAPGEGKQWFGYGKVGNEEEYLAKYGALVGALRESSLLSGFCYTQFTDTEQETNGLLDEYRQPKVAIEKIRAITSGDAG